MLLKVVIVCVLISFCRAQERVESQTQAECVKDLADWCKDTNSNSESSYSSSNFFFMNSQGMNSQGMSAQSVNTQGPNMQSVNTESMTIQGTNIQGPNGQGTNIQSTNIQGPSIQGANTSLEMMCTRDKSGANCTRNGEPLFSCTPQGDLRYKGRELTEYTIDGEICQTRDVVVKGLKFNQTAVDLALQRFRDSMQRFNEEMMNLQSSLSGIGGRLFGNFWPIRPHRPTLNYSPYDDDDAEKV